MKRTSRSLKWNTDDAPANVGKRIRMIRRRRRLEISLVAKITRISERRIAAIERGTGELPKRAELHAIAAALSVGMHAITGEPLPEFA